MGIEKIENGIAQNYAESYKLYGEKVCKESEQILKKAGITIPIGKSPEQQDEPIKGLSVEKTDDTKKSNTHGTTHKTREKGATNLTRVVNNTYNKLVSTQNKLTQKANLSESETEGLEDVNDLVNTVDDIDNIGQSHIDNLTEEMPESGLIQGNIYTSVERAKGTQTNTFHAIVNNQWQNKNKTFGITASASYGYEHNKYTGNSFEFDFESDSDTTEPKDLDTASTKTTDPTSAPKKDESDVPAADNSEQLSSETSKMGSISINTRFDSNKITLGAGIDSNFYPNSNQIHDQHITILHKDTNIGADLTRRTVVTKDEKTGETIQKSQMKFKIDLVNRKKDNLLSNNRTDKQSQQESEVSLADDTTATEDNPLLNIGKGWDIDFEYDNSKCGIAAQYGINLVNKPQKQFNLTIAPVAGIYDYTSPTDNNAEAVKGTAGLITEISKGWNDGQRVNASIIGAINRVAQNGAAPSDTKYISFEGSYINPGKNIFASLEAGAIDTGNMKMRYAELNAGYDIKDFNIGLHAGITNIKDNESSDNNYELGLKVAYRIPY